MNLILAYKECDKPEEMLKDIKVSNRKLGINVSH